MAETRDAVGISNRETPSEEAEERREHPPVANVNQSSEPSSGKSGVRSTSQKASESKYTDTPMPATSKTDGAFGRESGD